MLVVIISATITKVDLLDFVLLCNNYTISNTL